MRNLLRIVTVYKCSSKCCTRATPQCWPTSFWYWQEQFIAKSTFKTFCQFLSVSDLPACIFLALTCFRMLFQFDFQLSSIAPRWASCKSHENFLYTFFTVLFSWLRSFVNPLLILNYFRTIKFYFYLFSSFTGRPMSLPAQGIEVHITWTSLQNISECISIKMECASWRNNVK